MLAPSLNIAFRDMSLTPLLYKLHVTCSLSPRSSRGTEQAGRGAPMLGCSFSAAETGGSVYLHVSSTQPMPHI